MKVLVVDIGGNNVKLLASGQTEPLKVPSGPDLTPERMVRDTLEAVQDWEFDAVTVGYPGAVAHGKLLLEPKNLGEGWIGFDFAGAFGKPVKVINDAAMQALGSYEGGRMLFLGLGTGLGTALIIDNVIAPMELAHLPYKKKRTYEDYLGERGLQERGKKKWLESVADVVARFRAALVADYVVLGGGNAKKVEPLPPHCRLGDNKNAFMGGFRLWEVDEQTQRERYDNA